MFFVYVLVNGNDVFVEVLKDDVNQEGSVITQRPIRSGGFEVSSLDFRLALTIRTVLVDGKVV